MVFVGGAYEVIASELVSTGDETSTTCDAREIVARARALGARQLIMMHNHPTGSVMPSEEDVTQTNIVARLAADAGIYLVDHIICTASQRLSLMQARLATPMPTHPLALSHASIARAVTRMHARCQRTARLDHRAALLLGDGLVLACALYSEGRPASVSELAALLDMPPSVVALQLIAMREAGLVKVQPFDDEQGYLAAVTSAGLDLLDAVISSAFQTSRDPRTLRSFRSAVEGSARRNPHTPDR